MSEFSKNILVHNTYEKRIVHEPFKIVDRIIEARDINLNMSTLYEVEAGVYDKVWIDDHLQITNPEAKDHIIRQTKRRLIEHMFGEFRKPLMEIRRAMFNREIDKAEDLLSKLERQMFE